MAENRDVWRIDLLGRTIYAKCYRSQGFIKQLVERVRGLAAKREWLALRQAVAVGVHGPEALAYATALSGKSTYSAVLITAAMPADAISLEQAWLAAQEVADPRLGRREKGRLIEGLAELIARAHVGGLFHRDLHVGNILIYPHNGTVTAAMIDLHNARLCKGLVLSGIRNNLVQLNQWFARHASRTERLRFLISYCRHLRDRMADGAASGGDEGGLPGACGVTDNRLVATGGGIGGGAGHTPANLANRGAAGTAHPRPGMRGEVVATGRYGHKVLARHVLKVSQRYAARLYAKRDRRILKRNKYFSTVGLAGGWSARIALDIKHGRPYENPLDVLPDRKGWRELIADPVALLGAGGATELKKSGSRRVVQMDLSLGGAMWTVIAKHVWSESPLRWLLGKLGRNPLRREFVTGWRCLHRELPVALPLAILTRESPSRQESILLVEYITESRDLDTFTKMCLPEMSAAQVMQLKRGVSGAIARTLRRMWACNLAHRDLKAANIRLQIPQGDLERVAIVLVDVDGIRRPCWGLRKALLRSLARLDASFANSPMVTRTDRLRLLLAVLRGIDGGSVDWKDAWRQIRPMSLRDQATIAKTLPWLQPIAPAAGAQ